VATKTIDTKLYVAVYGERVISGITSFYPCFMNVYER